MECVVVSNTLGTEVWGTFIGGLGAGLVFVVPALLWMRYMDNE